jgi:hypothetical protein
MRVTVFIILAFLASSIGGQPVTVGDLEPIHNHGHSLPAGIAPVSYLDLSHPASASGQVAKVSIEWMYRSDCTQPNVKVLFLRSAAQGYTLIAERGPFTVSGRVNTLVLSPPVNVVQGDLVALVALHPMNVCGYPLSADSPTSVGTFLITNRDLSTGTLGQTVLYVTNSALGIVAFDSDPLVRVVPAAGAAQGIGAFFRTGLQLSNPSDATITGRVVFHPAGRPGVGSDPALNFELMPGRTLHYPDVVTTMQATGLGSLDIFSTSGVPPVVAARIYSDGGFSGTYGFSSDAFSPRDALGSSDTGALIGPGDTTNFRMNIGVRTLGHGATLKVDVYDARGIKVGATATRTYGADTFEQTTFAQFTGVNTLPENARIVVSVTAGEAFVYGTITDNRTSDSQMKVATVH